MKKPYKDLTGKKFGRLTVLSLVDDESGANVPTRYMCQCDCGNETIARAYNLKSGNTKSCGCYEKEVHIKQHYKHGKTGSRLHIIWAHMRGRCNRPSDKAFKWYGGRGIQICSEWNDFQAFYEWAMAHGYSDDLTIDRIDVNGNYCPENCRWVTLQEQQKNKRDNTFVEFEGQIKTVSEWANVFKCRPCSVYREILSREGRVKKCNEQ